MSRVDREVSQNRLKIPTGIECKNKELKLIVYKEQWGRPPIHNRANIQEVINRGNDLH